MCDPPQNLVLARPLRAGGSARPCFRSRAGSTMHQAPIAVTEDCLLTSRVSEVTNRVCRPRALYALRDSDTKRLNVVF